MCRYFDLPPEEKQARRHEVATLAAAARATEDAALQQHLAAMARFTEQCREYSQAQHRLAADDDGIGQLLPEVMGTSVTQYQHRTIRTAVGPFATRIIERNIEVYDWVFPAFLLRAQLIA
eukprot:COSAG05_NODE_1755_length_4142_cov_3.966114_3_plen_120_part_00